MTKEKPRIVRRLLKENDELVEIQIRDVVKPLGNSGYISVPKELIGEFVTVYFKKESKKSK